ncbi:unnamed protein product [Lactuca virosa]|uniref:Zinc finger PMZ-type domain-containing protein n=1 Tax=Lactuca virosa TaxID=75947 RepID=A0AAU9PP79_9ASTR|nr:unnamed protein product [Lactuca virosa]
MDEVFEPDTIDVQVDDFVKTKSVSRCKDEFLNVLCEDSDDESVEGEGENARVELDDEENTDESSDEDEIIYSIHNPKVKWNVMKPVIGERFYNLREEAQKLEGDVCEAALLKMEEFAEDIRTWYAVPSGVNSYEIRNGFQSYGVDLEHHYCSYRLWDIAGIPCVHAQVAILYTNQDPKEFISTWFSKSNYMATYQSNILPVNGSNLWEETGYTKPLPPTARRMPG